jgi:hypothetical protein
MMLDLHSICLQIHYAMTPHRISLLLVVFTVNRSGWRFLSQQFSHLLDSQVGSGIGDAGPIVEKLSVQSCNCQTAHESTSPGWIWVVHGMWSVRGASETQPCVWFHVADQLRKRSERIPGYVPKRRCARKVGQSSGWSSRRSWRFRENAEFLPATSAFSGSSPPTMPLSSGKLI